MTLKWPFPELTISYLQGIILHMCSQNQFIVLSLMNIVFYDFHRKIYSLGCHHCMSPVPLHVNEVPAHLDRPVIPLYPILTGSEKQMNTSFKVFIRKHSYYHYYIRFSTFNVLWSIQYDTQNDWLLFSTIIKWPLSVITAVQIWTGYEHVTHCVYSLCIYQCWYQ